MKLTTARLHVRSLVWEFSIVEMCLKRLHFCIMPCLIYLWKLHFLAISMACTFNGHAVLSFQKKKDHAMSGQSVAGCEQMFAPFSGISDVMMV